MIIPQGVAIYVATGPVDFRFGMERLGGVVRERMKTEPRTRKAMFVFVGRRRDALKVLFWDGTGTLLLTKRLDRGTFDVPPTREGVVTLSDAQFELLFSGLAAPSVH
jgi:transposase